MKGVIRMFVKASQAAGNKAYTTWVVIHKDIEAQMVVKSLELTAPALRVCWARAVLFKSEYAVKTGMTKLNC